MNNYQSVQYELPEEDLSDDDFSSDEPFEDLDADSSTEQPSNEAFNLFLWLKLLWQHPLIFWGGVWTILLLMMGLAVAGLMSPQLSTQRNTQDQLSNQSTVAIQPALQANETSGSLPMWSLGAIVIACAGGSMMISHRMKLAQQRPQRSLKATQKALSSHSTHTDADYAYPTALLPASDMNQSIAATVEPFQSAVPPFYQAFQEPIVVEPIASEPPVNAPIVTVVPADQSTPLDWPEGSLADLMDIRYRRQRSRHLPS